MLNFSFYSPTKVIFGKGAELSAADEIRNFGGSRVMVVYGGGSVVRSGLLDRIGKELDQAGLPYLTLGGVRPNPRVKLAREGVQKAYDFGADFILGVGGGSVIDTAKAIAIGAANFGTDIWRFWLKELVPQKALPVGAVLTIPAAGSETSNSAVLTNEDTQAKRGLNIDLNRPRFALMNPELSYTLPDFQVICGVVDIMMHTLDRYFTTTEGNELTDGIAEALLRDVIRNGAVAVRDHHNYAAMSELMWCGSLSHNGLTGLGRVNDFSVHQLGHELSGHFDVTHGASLSTMWGPWAQNVYAAKPERFAHYAKAVWDVETGSAEESAKAGIERTVNYFRSIGAPTSFSELGIGVRDDKTLQELTDSCTFRGKRTIGQFKMLDAGDIHSIYKLANH